MQSMFCVMIIPALKIKVLLKVAFVSGNTACKFKVYICICVCVSMFVSKSKRVTETERIGGNKWERQPLLVWAGKVKSLVCN